MKQHHSWHKRVITASLLFCTLTNAYAVYPLIYNFMENGEVYSLDPTSPSSEELIATITTSTPGILETNNVSLNSAALDPETMTFYFVNNAVNPGYARNRLYSMTLNTGGGVTITSQGLLSFGGTDLGNAKNGAWYDPDGAGSDPGGYYFIADGTDDLYRAVFDGGFTVEQVQTGLTDGVAGGPFNFQFGDIVFDENDNRLFVSAPESGAQHDFWVFDTTNISTGGITYVDSRQLSFSNIANGLSFDNTTDTLYGFTQAVGMDPDRVFTIQQEDGGGIQAGTPLVDLGSYGNASNSAGDMTLVVYVPEPSVITLCALGAVSLVCRRKRKSS